MKSTIQHAAEYTAVAEPAAAFDGSIHASAYPPGAEHRFVSAVRRTPANPLTEGVNSLAGKVLASLRFEREHSRTAS